MKPIFRRLFNVVTLAGLTMLIAACSGSGDNSLVILDSSKTVSGVVMAGPVSGAAVTVFTASGTRVAGPAMTAADGSYSVSIPKEFLTEDLVFDASGGTFPDEATGTAGITLRTLSARVPAGTLTAGTNVTIDPASTIINELIKKGTSRSAALTAFSTAFGYTPDAAVMPVFAGISSAATTAQRLSGLRAAAFSQLAKDLGIPAARQDELFLALAEDLTDGVLDGRKSGGAEVMTASATAIPVDICNRFANALMTYQTNRNLNKSKLTPDKIGAPVFAKKALTAHYIVEYVPGAMPAATGKSTFQIKLSNLDGSPANGKAVTLRPYMYMATKSHTTPMESVVESGTPGIYNATVYYVMSTAMNGMSMGVWELKITVDGSESVIFYPTVGMPMGNTTLAKLSGIDDAIMGMAGIEKRTWFLFNDGLIYGAGGNSTFKIFLATKEMGAMLTFPAVETGNTLNDETGAPWTANSIVLEVSTNKSTWLPATETGSGHWTAAGLTGLTAATGGKIYVRLTVNGELKTTDGFALAADGLNGYQTFTVSPM